VFRRFLITRYQIASRLAESVHGIPNPVPVTGPEKPQKLLPSFGIIAGVNERSQFCPLCDRATPGISFTSAGNRVWSKAGEFSAVFFNGVSILPRLVANFHAARFFGEAGI